MASVGLNPTAREVDVKPFPLVAAVMMGTVAGAILVTLPMLEKNALFVGLGALALLIGLWVSGNPRLTLLWGLVLTAPLALAKSFMPTPHMGGASAYQIELSDIFVVALLSLQIRDRLAGYLPRLRFPAPLVWWALLTALGAVPLAMGPFRQLAALQMFQMLKEGILFFVIVNELVRVKQFIQLTTALAVLVIGIALIAFGEFLFRGPLGLEFLGEATREDAELTNYATYLQRGGGGIYRTGSLLGHPNLLAIFMAMNIPVILGGLFSSIDLLRRLLFIVAVAMGAVALMLTLSRTGWIAGAAALSGMMILASFHPRVRKRNVRLRLTMLVSMIAGIIVALPIVIQRFTQSDPGAVDFRYEWMGVAWNFVQRDPVFGIGLNTFIYNLPGNTKYGDVMGLNDQFGEIWPVVHNIYLLIWSEQGTVGLIFFLGMYLSLVVIGFRNILGPVNDRMYMIGAGCLAAVGASMIDGFSSFLLRNTNGPRSFWIIAAMLVAMNYWNRDNSPERLSARAQRQAVEPD